MKPVRLWIYNLITRCLPETRCFQLKVHLLRWCGATLGSNVRINSSAVFSGNGQLIIEDDVWIGPRCYISPVSESTVIIETCVDIAPEVMILTGSHRVEPQGMHIGGKGFSASVTIGAGSWLGARATVLPGVALAKKTVVAAGAVVTHSFPLCSNLIAGVPATQKRLYKP